MASAKMGFSGNALKIIAAITMLIDHIGVTLLPEISLLRIIGRISFPIFAYMIAEGCYYTRNKIRYFGGIFILGVTCQLVYTLYMGDELLGILITFSISILAVYALQYMKEVFASGKGASKKIFSALLFASAVVGIYFLNEVLYIDYGFFGCMAPVFASAFKMPRKDKAAAPKNSFLKERLPNVLSLGACLVLLGIAMRGHQFFALLSLPILLLYSGRRGKLKMKYFFYVFYPAHLLILEGIYYLIN